MDNGFISIFHPFSCIFQFPKCKSHFSRGIHSQLNRRKKSDLPTRNQKASQLDFSGVAPQRFRPGIGWSRLDAGQGMDMFGYSLISYYIIIWLCIYTQILRCVYIYIYVLWYIYIYTHWFLRIMKKLFLRNWEEFIGGKFNVWHKNFMNIWRTSWARELVSATMTIMWRNVSTECYSDLFW